MHVSVKKESTNGQKHLLIVTVSTAAVAGKRKNYSDLVSNPLIRNHNGGSRKLCTAEVTITYITET